MSAPILNVSMLWHTIGQGNLGVDALARANIAIVRTAAERAGRSARFTTIGLGQPKTLNDLPHDVRVGPGPRIKQILRGRSQYLPIMRASDLVIDIGEGDSWADIYGTWRFVLQSGTKLSALQAGKPLILAPQTIGPFNSPVRRRLANWIMNRCAAVFARDHLSMAYLKDAHITAPTDEFIDVAFRLPFTPQPKVPGKVRVGLNVSGLLYRGGYSGANELGLTIDYRGFTHAVIENLLARDDYEVHLISHVIGTGVGNDDDRSVAAELAKLYPAVVNAPLFASASEAKGYISGLDVLVGGRMHACIGAFSAGVPVIPIAYSRKFNGLFGTLGYTYLVDGKTATTEEAIATTLDWIDRRETLGEALVAGRALAETRLAAYEDRLTAIIEAL